MLILPATTTPWYAITATLAGYLLTLILIRWVLLTKKEQSASTVAWIMAIILIPLLGGALFILFGINRVDRRARLKGAKDRAIRRQLPNISRYQVLPSEIESPLTRNIARLADTIGPNCLTDGNDIRVMNDTHETLGLTEQAIESAGQTIHLAYYIWRRDKTGTRLRDLIIRKAREGVKVRFLYDGIGSLFLNERFIRPMREAGIDVASSLPGTTIRERWSLNLRNHRKIVVVDGKIGFTGGMNIGDEYLGRSHNCGYWRDTHLRVEGPTVLQLQQTFAEDWFYATNEPLTDLALYPDSDDPGKTNAQVIASGPTGDKNLSRLVFFEAIAQARRSIQLTTGYFVPPPEFIQALVAAALRGVRVRILVPGRPSYSWKIDYLAPVYAGRSYYENLLEAGVEIYEYQRGVMHAKTMTVDGTWSLVGGANFDARSLMLNFEVGLAISGPRIAQQLEEHFATDLEDSLRIDPEHWSNRPTRRILAENACRMFAPVL